MNTPESVGRVCDAGFVPHVHDIDSALARYRQHVIQMIAHQCKDVVDTEFQHRVDKQIRADCHNEP